MELPWHRARGKQRSMRDAPVSGSSLYDFRLRASSARHDPQPPQAASHGMYPALPTLRAPPSYLRMMSAFWSWNSRKPSKIMSPCGHDSRGTTLGKERRGQCSSRARVLPHHSNPDALAQLPSDVAQSVDAIKAKRLKPTVPQHSRHLRVLCTTWERWVAGCAGSVAVQLQRATLTILLEGQLTLGL